MIYNNYTDWEKTVDYERAKALLQRYGQNQLLDYYDELDESRRRILLDDIEKVNFSVIENINKDRTKSNKGKISPIPAKSLQDIAKNKKKYEEEGINLLKLNKVGAVLLAGGQGTRLGFDKPKGMFNIGETRTLTIFEQLMNNVKQVTDLTEAYFPLFIMTSTINHDETVSYFKDNGYFGYPEDKIHFYIQDTEPVCCFD